MARLLDIAYVLFLTLISPVLFWRAWRYGKYRQGWGEKLFGRVPVRTSNRPCCWIHAVSVGEVLLMTDLVERLRNERPELEFVITSTTVTGRDVAREKFPNDLVCFAPLDFSWAVTETITRLRPSMLLLAELELWPNMIRIPAANGIPVSVINARLGEKSFRGYRRLKPIFKPLMKKLSCVAAQTKDYADRFVELGVPTERVHVTGSLKFDRVITNRSNPLTEELRQAFRISDDELVWVAGSTTAPEEHVILRAYQKLRESFPHLRLLLVPRHRERFDEVAGLILKMGFDLSRRSSNFYSQENESPVLLLDTLGELSACWGLADYAFVGGSLPGVGRGGQNMLEPAAFGVPTIIGPETWNFKDVVEQLMAADAAPVVRNDSEIVTQLSKWITTPDNAKAIGNRAADVVASGRGATDKTLSLLIQPQSHETRRAA
ncbi:3-deoxy-D-manno-octulosonic acid transferase [Calycomorphotria hydatis]|uniref:3-deoxy-D-manno-octulosonic acid transferase n=1 Tax=Calycomorphotria hydatis TaxID=2528027 RepID=A0A517TC87_9PLAN|nr:3-deoxy-D-manno-octulosonic acid transferase [Calycomorphotria hydatis]QDT65970.1 3-deoxy-D-manno-octulosonic acid transferase [Calycomorphotria hydatis]